MLKDLFDGTCRIVPTKMDWTALDPPENADEKVEVVAEDSVAWRREPDCLSVKCTRVVAFSPECNFRIEVSYVVEHLLKTEHSLDALSNEEIDKEVREHIGFYIQENQGLMGRVSLIISQLTSAFGAPPLILPPSYQLRKE